MWYKTYASCKYAKIPISIYIGNIIFEHLLTYDLCINMEFGQGNPILSLLDNTYVFIYFGLSHTTWGPKINSQRLHLIFPMISLFIFVHWDWEDVGSNTRTLISFYFLFFWFSPSWPRGWGIEPTQPHFNFSLNSFYST